MKLIINIHPIKIQNYIGILPSSVPGSLILLIYIKPYIIKENNHHAVILYDDITINVFKMKLINT